MGCHPSAPPLSVFGDFRAALGHVDCCARDMRAVVGDWDGDLDSWHKKTNVAIDTIGKQSNLILKWPAKKISGQEVWTVAVSGPQDFLSFNAQP